MKMNLISLIKDKMLYTSQKNSLISANIANANTPNFKAMELQPFKSNLNFKTNLNLTNTNSKHIKNSKKPLSFNTFYTNDTYVKNDGNNVDLEKELTNMHKNNIRHHEAINIYNKIISLFKINAGSR